MGKSKVAIVRCDSYESEKVYAAVREAVSLLGGISAFVKKGEKILLKPNVLTGAKSDEAVTTHPAVFEAAIRLLEEGGVVLSCGDSPGFGKPAEAFAKCGLAEVAERHAVPLADFEKGRSVGNPDGVIGKRFDLANASLECDGIVSLPKMKTHQLTRITGAMKNQFGCVYGLNKASFHVKVPNQVQFSKLLVDLNKMLPMRLFIMDGIVAMEGNGPRSGTPVPMNCVIVSSDPVAVDATFCRMIGLDPECIPTITFGHERGLGNYLTGDIEYPGLKPEDFLKSDFNVVRKPVVAETTAGFVGIPSVIRNALYPRPVIDASVCVRCGVCVDSCPVEGKALAFRNGNLKKSPKYSYDKCIRCYCCQEMCPYKAISVRRPLLSRFVR